MVTLSKHSSLNVCLIQARDTLMSIFRPLLNENGVTDQQWRIILLLAENGILDFQDLANQACILRPSLTGILTRLEQSGYIVRLKPSNDQRRVFLKLTKKGEDFYQQFSLKVDKCYDELEQLFSNDEIKDLRQRLNHFSEVLKQHQDAQLEK